MYKVKENKVEYQERKGLTYEIQPYCRYSVVDENTFVICHIPDYVSNQKEKAELIVKLLNEDLCQ